MKSISVSIAALTSLIGGSHFRIMGSVVLYINLTTKLFVINKKKQKKKTLICQNHFLNGENKLYDVIVSTDLETYHMHDAHQTYL